MFQLIFAIFFSKKSCFAFCCLDLDRETAHFVLHRDKTQQHVPSLHYGSTSFTLFLKNGVKQHQPTQMLLSPKKCINLWKEMLFHPNKIKSWSEKHLSPNICLVEKTSNLPRTPPPLFGCFFLHQNRRCFHPFGSLNQLCLTTKPRGAVKSCELPWRFFHRFHHQICRGVFFVGLLTSLKWDGSLLKEITKQEWVELKQNMPTTFLVGGGICLVWICHCFFPVVSCSTGCHEK